MSGWPLPEEQQDWATVAEWDDAVERRAAELTQDGVLLETAAFIDDVSTEMSSRPLWGWLGKRARRAAERRARAVAAIEKDMRREAQRRGGGSWRT